MQHPASHPRFPVRSLLFHVLRLVPLLCALPVGAATLVMDNGDRLSGDIVRLSNGQLTFRTDYAGTLTIPWSRVAELQTDKDVAVWLQDGQIERGRLSGRPADGLTLRQQQDEQPQVDRVVSADDIKGINPEPWRTGGGLRWTGLLNLSIKADRGNTVKDEIDLDLTTALRRQYDRFEFRGDLEYDTSGGVETKNKWSAFGKYEYFVTDRLYYAANLSAEYDRFKGLNDRYHVGPAVGYVFHESDRRNLRAEAGLYYATSDIDPNGRSSSLATGWLIDADRHLGSALQAYHWQSMILSNPENMNFKSKTGLRVPLDGGVVGSAEIEANWDAETAAESDSTEVIYRLKVGYGW